MKTKLFIRILLFCIVVLNYACDESDKIEGVIDYSKYRVAQVVNHNVGGVAFNDTTNYVYDDEGDLLSRTIKYGSNADAYITTYTKNGSTIDAETRRDGILTLDGYYQLLPNGKIDTTYFYDHIANQVSSTAKYEYNSDLKQIRNLNVYDDYITDIKRNFNGGNYSYWIYERTDIDTPSNTSKDSIVYDYYTDIPLLVPYAFVLNNRFGNPNDNLVKTRTYYDLLNSNQITQVYNYEYLINDIGLVTQQMWESVEQPSGIISSTNMISYSYIVID